MTKYFSDPEFLSTLNLDQPERKEPKYRSGAFRTHFERRSKILLKLIIELLWQSPKIAVKT